MTSLIDNDSHLGLARLYGILPNMFSDKYEYGYCKLLEVNMSS